MSVGGRAGQPADAVEELPDAGQCLAGGCFAVEGEGVGGQVRVEGHAGAGGEAADVHREGIIGWQPKGFVFQSPVFDEGDVGVGKGGGCGGHKVKDTRKMGNGEGEEMWDEC